MANQDFANLEQARRAGLKAAKDGKRRDDNPFGPGQRPEFHFWRKGFDEQSAQ